MSLTYLLTHRVNKSRTPGDFNYKESEAGEERESGVHGVTWTHTKPDLIKSAICGLSGAHVVIVNIVSLFNLSSPCINQPIAEAEQCCGHDA